MDYYDELIEVQEFKKSKAYKALEIPLPTIIGNVTFINKTKIIQDSYNTTTFKDNVCTNMQNTAATAKRHSVVDSHKNSHLGFSFVADIPSVMAQYTNEDQQLLTKYIRFHSLRDLCDVFLSRPEAKLIKYCEGTTYTKVGQLWKVEKENKIVRALIAKGSTDFFTPALSLVESEPSLAEYRTMTVTFLRRIESNSTLNYLENLCLLKLSDQDFEKRLDNNLSILPFPNGYIDLKDKQFK